MGAKFGEIRAPLSGDVYRAVGKDVGWWLNLGVSIVDTNGTGCTESAPKWVGRVVGARLNLNLARVDARLSRLVLAAGSSAGCSTWW